MAGNYEEKRAVKLPHNIILEDRKTLMVTGVSDVDSFDDQAIVAFTDMDELTIRGTSLQISKLSTDTGELSVTGNIIALAYTDDNHQRSGLFGRLFK